MLKYLVVGEILLFLVMNKKNKGFTLTETLLTITILVILFALAVPGVFTIKKNLRQMELDDKAEIIYTAVQNRLSELYTSGLSNLYDPSGKSYISPLGNVPGDYDNTVDNDAINENSIYYFTSKNISELEALIGSNVIDDSLKNCHFVVEYMPYAKRNSFTDPANLTVPFVYAVYYSEDLIDVSEEYSPGNKDYLSNYRLKQIRLEKGAKLGYYGGSTPGSGSSTKTITISSAKIYSEEEVNRAVIKGRIGPGVDIKTVKFTFEFRDEHGKTVTYFYNPVTDVASYKTNGVAETQLNKDYYKISKVGNNYTFDFLIDDLSSESKRFKSIFSGLTAGDDITLTTNTECTEGTVICYDKTTVGNSIFADRKDNGNDNNTAYISNGRHLQNLHSESGVYQDYSKALLLNDIDFNKDGKFSTTYIDSYINGTISINRISNTGNVNGVVVPCFKGIVNSNLRLLDGKGFTIKGLASRSGLFNTVDHNLSITDLNMTGERVYGNDTVAGGLISTINSGGVTINNCGIYLDNTIDIPTNINSKYYLEAVRWIYGQEVSGGLVGLNKGTLNISSSFVATNIGLSNKNAITGGLIGKNEGTININKTYTDCYLYGNTVGGLVGEGNGTINISSAYSAGFIGTDGSDDAKLAGLVFGEVNEIKNSYTVIAKGYLDNTRLIGTNTGITLDTKEDNSIYYATVKSSVNSKNVYFLRGDKNTDVGDYYNELTTNLGDDFNLTGISSYPYKLMGTSLTSYNYHKLVGMKHYGDWSASFAPGSLVYYEKYKVGTREVYGFDGANVENSLNDKNDIVGDGYGVAFRTTDIIKGGSFEVDGNKIDFSSTYYEVTKGNVNYRVYPIDITNFNTAIEGFYKKCVISTKSGSKTFYFNPHFGHSAIESDTKPEVPNNVYIRSPHHLNNLAVLYKDYRNILGNNVTYTQERKMDYVAYEWTNFGTNKKVVTYQVPIGETKNDSFIGTYKGGSFEINNINFKTESGTYIGLFGYNSGTIKDVVVATQYAINGSSYNVTRKEPIGSNQDAYFGVLVGYNDGVIDNSAIAGYYLAGEQGKIYGYRNSTVYIGGLVGYNSANGSITNSAADLPKLSIDMNTATAYAGSFVGYNEGIIDNTYGISLIESKAPDGDTKIAGFAGYNTGTINNSYCATSLISSGNGSKTYNFAPNFGGGTVNNSYYLHGGSFNYIDSLYSFDGTNETSGVNKIYEELVTLKGNSKAATSKYHNLTTSLDGNEVDYPYRAIVKDSDDKLIHYGEWQVKPELGVVGVFYWEHEEQGQNNGYKITFIGSSYGNLAYSSNLCTQHDDGGVITEYGYGFYYGKGVDITTETQKFTNLVSSSSINTDVKAELERQMPHIQFYPYTTTTDTSKSYIYLKGEEPNGNIELTLGDETYNFTISPFFANAISFNTKLTTSDSNAQQFINKQPGLDNNPYEVRSADQLQYINWNSSNSSSKNLVDTSNYQKFNYLMYTTIPNGTGNQSSSGAGNSVAKNYVFKQSHDLNAKDIENFVPISGQSTSSASSYNAILYSWFGGTYDGQSYKIQELKINSKSFTVGLFGVTVDANLKNTILYSTQGAIITRSTENTDNNGAYALGGLVGIAYGYNNEANAKIENCAIAGYKVIDDSKNTLTLGEANVGGLIGVSNVNIDRCSAVVDIEINCKHEGTNGKFTQAEWGNFIRVGGISGAVQDEVTNSYSGGSIKVGADTLKETYRKKYDVYTNYVSVSSNENAYVNGSTNIYLAGIAGSGFTMNYQNFTGNSNIKDGNPKIKNCYTYMDFPALEGTIRSITMMTSAADRYGQGAVKVDIRNCYYLERSGKIDMSKAPAYYFSRNNAYSYLRSWTEDQIKQMVLGSSLPISQYFSGTNNSSGMNNGDSSLDINNTSKKYEELSNSTMNGTLGATVFGDVSTEDDSGNVVNGKYSFSAGNMSLTGKDYPFPTVIKQEEGKRTVNVHYGSWPLESAYFEQGSGTIDIFDDMSNDGFAYKEFVLNSSGQNITDLSFTVEESEYAELAQYSDGNLYIKDADGNYKINVKAMKAGATDITAAWKVDGISFGAKFNLVVTANLNLIIQPEHTIYMNSGETKVFGYGKKVSAGIEKFILATASDVTKDYSDIVTWTITSSKIGTEEQNAFEIDDNYKDIFKITSNGFNGIVTATATYDYNGNKYSSSANINILTNYTVGICGNNYSEITINDTNLATMATSPSYGTFGPKNNESKYFIYERNDPNATVNNDLIKKVIIDDISLSSSNPDIQNEINNGLVDIKLYNLVTNSISNNDYNTRAITFSYRGYKYDTFECTLKVNIRNNNGDTFPLEVPVTVNTVPYKLTLDANGGTIENHATKVIELTVGTDVVLTDIKPDLKTGYEFNGWYDENGSKVESFTAQNKDVYLKAKYVPKSSQISFNSALIGEGSNLETITRSYDDFSNISLTNTTKDGYILEGWYDSDDVKVADADGKILEKELFNQYLLVHINDENKTVELQAHWNEAVKLTLNATDINGNKSSSVINYEKGTILSHVDIPTYNLKDGYTFEGFFQDDGTKVVDKDGYANLFLDNDLSLNAIFKIKGYTKVNDFEENNNYLIVSGDYAMSSENAKNDDSYYRNAEIISKKIDVFGNVYISSDNPNLIWTRKTNKYLYNSVVNNYLNAGYYLGYYLTTSKTAQSWNYIDKDNVKKLYNDNYIRGYVGLDATNKRFTNDSSGESIEIYKYSEDIKVNYYESANVGGTE